MTDDRMAAARRTMDSWTEKSSALGGALMVSAGLGIDFRARMEEALAAAGAEGDEKGLLSALCREHPRRGLAFSLPHLKADDADTEPYRCIIDAIRLWGEGMDLWRVSLMAAYDESTLHRVLPKGWGKAREELFSECLHGSGDDLIPRREHVRVRQKTDKVTYYVSVVEEHEGRKNSRLHAYRSGSVRPRVDSLPIGDVCYDAWSRLENPLQVLKTVGWDRVAALMAIAKYGVDGGSGDWCIRFALECLDRSGTEGFDKALDVLRIMWDGKWQAPKPEAGDVCNSLPMAFNVETLKARTDGGPASWSGNLDQYRKDVLSIVGGFFAPYYKSGLNDHLWEQNLQFLLLTGRGGSFRSTTRRMEILNALQALQDMPAKERRACGPWFAGSVLTITDFLHLFQAGWQGLLRCSVMMIVDANLDNGVSPVNTHGGRLSMHTLKKRGFNRLPKAYKDYITDGIQPKRTLPKGIRAWLGGDMGTAEGIMRMIGADPKASDVRGLVEHAFIRLYGNSQTAVMPE